MSAGFEFKTGTVWLVGAGPGDPGLLTLRGAEVLAAADLVLYDGLVNPLLLKMTDAVCERTARIRRDEAAVVPQDQINSRLIEAARSGLNVVRLKGGDPCVFGRGSEESEALRDAGISFEIVPGVTAATAAAEYAGFSFTHREVSSAVALVAGQQAADRLPTSLNAEALAEFPGTLVFYMGLNRIKSLSDQLVDHGLDPNTPAAVISEATLPGQRVLVSVLGRIAEDAVEQEMRPPSLIIVGECVSLKHEPSWFEQLPLFGLTIAVMRPEEQCVETALRISRLGGRPVILPMIEVRSVDGPKLQFAREIISDLSHFSWVVWTSVNGVHGFFEILSDLGLDSRALGHAKLACIGPATASALRDYGLNADLVPGEFRGENLARELTEKVSAGDKVVWFRADRGREVIPEMLAAAGIPLQGVVVYRNTDKETPVSEDLEVLVREQVNWVCLTSPSIAKRFGQVMMTDSEGAGHFTAQVACISPVTAAAARECGLRVDATADVYTVDGLLDAIHKAENAKSA
jgi:uroporphyrinogen III methyltransferase/synthase